MDRRKVLAVLASLPVLAGAPRPARAQSGKTVRVGYLLSGTRAPDGLPPKPFRDAMRTLGYADGAVTYDLRAADGRLERLPDLAAELVGLRPDALVTHGGLATLAVKRATATIPIIMAVAAGDAVRTEMIASLAHPGGNVTGMSDELVELSAKRMQLLKETVPGARTIAVLWNVNDQGMTLRYQEIDRAAQLLRVRIVPVSVRSPEDFGPALTAMAARKPDAMFLVSDAMTNVNRRQLLDFAASRRIPAMYEYEFYVKDGGLMSYGPNNEESLRRAASYLDRILKGAKVAELPAELPTRNYLAVNLKTAAALGLAMPPSVLALADVVVE